MQRPAAPLSFPRPSRPIVWLLVSLVVPWAIGVVLNIASSFRGGLAMTWLIDPLAWDAPRIFAGQVWRLVTYAWVQTPERFLSLLLDGVMLWLFGTSLQQERGTRRMLQVFGAGVVAGGVALVIASALMAAIFDVGAGPYMGAQPAVSALFAAVCWGWRSRMLNLVLLQVKGLHLLLFFVALDVLRVLTTGSVEPFASLGGVVAGIVVIDDLWRPSVLRTRWRLWRSGRALREVGRDSPVRWVN